MIEQAHAQVARDGVADRRSEPGLGHAEDRREQEETDHRTDEPPQEPDVDAGAVGGEQRLIEDLLHDERRDDADRGAATTMTPVRTMRPRRGGTSRRRARRGSRPGAPPR
jgi:hypothetical protein